MRDGSLSGAGRRLGLAQPTVGRHIDALESALGLPLFARSPRGLAPTEAAANLVPHVEAMAAASAALARAAAGEASATRGVVRVTASEIIGCEVLPAIFATFRAKNPGVAIELALTNRNEDLSRRDADIAVRMVRPTQSALVARRIGETRNRALCPPGLSRAVRDADLSRGARRASPDRLRPRRPRLSIGRRACGPAFAQVVRLPLRQRSRTARGAARRRRHRRLPGQHRPAHARADAGAGERDRVHAGDMARHARGHEGDAPRAVAVRTSGGGADGFRAGAATDTGRVSRSGPRAPHRSRPWLVGVRRLARDIGAL